jgi:hypothetical protein
MHNESNADTKQETTQKEAVESNSTPPIIVRFRQRGATQNVEKGAKNIQNGTYSYLHAPSDDMRQVHQYQVTSNQGTQTESGHEETLLDFWKGAPPKPFVISFKQYGEHEGRGANIKAI